MSSGEWVCPKKVIAPRRRECTVREGFTARSALATTWKLANLLRSKSCKIPLSTGRTFLAQREPVLSDFHGPK